MPIDTGRALPPRRLIRGARQLGHLLGSRLLVGITFRDPDGAVLRREQFCGTVLEITQDGVVVVDRGELEPAVLPADPDAYEAAQPGTYRLVETGEDVIDPDYVTVWEVQQRPADGSASDGSDGGV